jgi:hypothetical protein
MLSSSSALNSHRSSIESHNTKPATKPRAWTLIRLASLRIAQRAFGAAIKLEQEAVALYRRLKDRTGEATALINLARVHICAGDPRPAIAPLQRCLEILHPWHPQERRLIQGAAGNLVLWAPGASTPPRSPSSARWRSTKKPPSPCSTSSSSSAAAACRAPSGSAPFEQLQT